MKADADAGPESFEHFREQALADGFDEVLQRDWPAGTVLEPHTHPFAVRARVTAGCMWLDCGDGPRELRPGDRFTLAHSQPHAERYGPEGASYWVARRVGVDGE